MEKLDPKNPPKPKLSGLSKEEIKKVWNSGKECHKKTIKLYNCDNLELMATLPDESIDVICIDPPYLYLKNQKLERFFDEPLFFAECKRLLIKNGFIVMFGRGTSFYRWNTLLDGLGFAFKEEIVWDKKQCSSPLMAISRIHETISIFTKGNGSINRIKIPYIEARQGNMDAVISDVKRLKTILKNSKSLDNVLEYLINNTSNFYVERSNKHQVQVESHIKNEDRCVGVVKSFDNGMSERTIIRSDLNKESVNKHELRSACNDGDRNVNLINSISNGMNEQTIIKHVRDHYTSIHPTQKPVRLIERLLALVIPDKPRNEIVVADFFGGSMSTMEAVHNMGMQGIATEIDKEYYLAGENRIEGLRLIQQQLF